MPEKPRVASRLAQVRKSRGIAASDLAKRVNVSRQTIYAIEAGTYVPNTEVALRLAHELEVTVDDLFTLQPGSLHTLDTLSTELLSDSPPAEGQPVRICKIGSRWVSVPVSASPYYLPEADAVIKRASRPSRAPGHAEVVAFSDGEAAQKRLLLAGCDPATNLLTRMVEKATGVEIVSAAASSTLALSWLKEGKVHIAGSHLEDPKTGEFNMPFVRKEFPAGDILVVTFARWEEGLVSAPGNPKRVNGVEDLARKNVRFVNREVGSGARALIDKLLGKASIDSKRVHGYDRVAFGHLAAAYCVLSGDADTCLATRSAAQVFGLDFVPLKSERYDLVMRKRTAELPAVQAFLNVLQRAALRRKLEVLAGYDTSQTGTVVL